MTRKILLSVLVFLSAAAAAPAVELTTRLLDAKPGSWVRRYEPNSHSRTLYVADATPDAVVIQLLRHHRSSISSNERLTIPRDYLKKHAVNPDSPHARSDSIEHKGQAYQVKIVTGPLDESDGDYYISEAMPANGVIRIDILREQGDPIVKWTDDYGETPDDLLESIGPGDDANAKYGIPTPKND